jgi:hypothetical protein
MKAIRHIRDELIEEYVAGRLAGPSLKRVEDHLRICLRCQKRIHAEDDPVCQMHETVSTLKLFSTRATVRGEITMLVCNLRGKHIGLVVGRDVRLLQECASEQDAIRWCEDTVAELFRL